MGARITAAVAALTVIALLAGAIGNGGAHASGGTVTNVTEPNGGVVVLQGGTWNVYAPSNHSTGTNGSANVYTNNGDWVSVGGDTPLPSGSTHSIPFNSGNTLIVCNPGAANSNVSGCHTGNGNLGIQKTFAGDPELAMVSFNNSQFPNFCWCQTSGYSTTVDGTTSSITVSAIPEDSNGASYKVNGSSGQQVVNLNPSGQDTPITVTGVGNNGTSTQDYTFTVHRGLSNADLSGLSISPGSISGFSTGTLTYSTNVPKATTQVTVTPTLSADDASYALQVGGDPVSNPVTLNDDGPTQIDVVVTAGDGTTTKTYSVTVTKGLTDADLSALTISPGSINFDGSTAYNASVPSTTTQVTVTPTLDDTSDGTAASFEMKVGENVVTNPITLNGTDPTQVDVVVTADDGTTTKTYSITVTHLLSIGLHVKFSGSGKGTVTSSEPDNKVNCSTTSPKAASCTVAYDQGTGVTLQESVATGSFFNGWSGDCAGSDTTTEFAMPGSTATCTADFESLGAKQSGTAFKVTTENDDPAADDANCYSARCTLRDALAHAPSGATITFANSVSTIELGDGLLLNTGKTLTIDGGGDVAINGSSADVRSLSLTSGKLTLKNIVFYGNEGNGGLSDSSGTTLTLNSVGVYDNGAETGGGIFSAGTLSVTNSELSDNGSDLGGGLFVAGGTATLTGVNVSDNFAFDGGAGIRVDAGATLTMTGGFVQSGEAFGPGGGLLVAGQATVTNTVVADNEAESPGGGVAVEDGGTASFTNATLTENVSNWTVATDGSGVAKFVNSTVAGNGAGGFSGGGISYLNTLVAENSNPACDGSAEPTSLGHNVTDDESCTTTTGDVADAVVNIGEPGDDGLVPLGYGSAAIDAGTKTAAGGLTVPTKDARGTARPQGAGIDVGAVEMPQHKLTIKTAGPGKGTVTPPTGSYVAGGTIPVTATPNADGSQFSGWSGACSGTNPEFDLVLNADATCTATFTKVPSITSFTPTSSRIRSTVTIVGSGFTGTTAVSFGTHAAASFKVVSDTKITAVVPDDAESGAIKVTNPAGDFSSITNWTLLWVAPKITSFTPAKAGTGATVTLTGTSFFGATAVDFDGSEADFTVVSDTKITATVPSDATSGPIHVSIPVGQPAGSKTNFTFIPPPSISAVDPDSAHAPVGGTLTLTGTGFTRVSAVKINGVAGKFKFVNDTSVTVVVPDTATDGSITLTTPGGTATSPVDYTQTFLPPTITLFTPTSGPIRTKVTITGTHFRGASELSFGGQDAVTWTVVSDTKITATVPDLALTGTIAVTTPGGVGTSTKSFKVTWPVPKITSFTPATGPAGTTVTITGSGLLGATDVQLNGTECDYLVVSATKITFTVPDGATTGKIKVTTPGGTATSTKSFTVLVIP